MSYSSRWCLPLPSRELGGTAGLYRRPAEQQLKEVVFANDLSWTVHGVDAVLRDSQTSRYILCEAKGTEQPIADSPLRYLRRTRTKGRQLLFRLLAPFLNGQVERLLVVTHLGRGTGGWTVGNAHAWRDADLSAIPELAVPYDLDRQRRWLADLAVDHAP